MIKSILILLLLGILLSYSTTALFGIINPPPGLQPGQVCIKGQPCNITAPLYFYDDIYMNGYTIYNVTLTNVTFSEIIYVNYTQVTNPIWLNTTGGDMTGDIDMNNNNITNIYRLEATLFCDGLGTCYDLTTLANDTRTYGGGEYLITTTSGTTITITLNETRLNEQILDQITVEACDPSTDIACKSVTNNFTQDQIILDDYKWYFSVQNNSYITYNTTNGTIQLWANGILQQEWGASTIIYGKATFLSDAIFQNMSGEGLFINTNVFVQNNVTTLEYFVGNGTYITDVCHTDGTGCEGINISIQNLINDSVYQESLYRINNDSFLLNLIDNETFYRIQNDSYLLNTINNEIFYRIQNDSYLLNLINNNTNTEKAGGGPYLYNDSDSIYLNETELNKTIIQIADIQSYSLYFNVTVSGGYGQAISPQSINYLITQVTVYPPSTPINYRFMLNETTSGDIIDRDRIPHTGDWDIYKQHSLNDTVTATIPNSNVDGIFTVRIKYIDNVIQV